MNQPHSLWPRSFPDIVASAHRCRGLRHWARAEAEYLEAAAAAPDRTYERSARLDAWECHERANGRVSELEERT